MILGGDFSAGFWAICGTIFGSSRDGRFWSSVACKGLPPISDEGIDELPVSWSMLLNTLHNGKFIFGLIFGDIFGGWFFGRYLGQFLGPAGMAIFGHQAPISDESIDKLPVSWSMLLNRMHTRKFIFGLMSGVILGAIFWAWRWNIFIDPLFIMINWKRP